jgi:hypothetical protein
MGPMAGERRLTRRDVLSGAAAAGAGLLIGPAAARAAGDHGADAGGRVFSRAVGRLRAGETVVVTPGRRFCLAGVRWSAPADAHLQLRTRRRDGSWGPWAIASSDGHEGDGVHPRDHVGDGVWTGPASELALRSHGAADGVTVQFVAADAVGASGASLGWRGGEVAADATGLTAGAAGALPLAGPVLPAGPGQPPIIARQVWAGTNHPPVGGPYYGAIRMGIVHHTENPNGYSRDEVPAMLRAIYEYHVHGRGWFDIGYNYVVDHFGRIWEARQGGINLPVMGAQAGDWNQISSGVSMLGTYTDIVPPPAALAAVQRLLAWKMAINGVPSIGEISAVVGADDVGWTQFRAGEHVRFPRIAGHRDVDSTDCPGDALYAHLPRMRPQIAHLEGVPATLELDGELAWLATGSVLNLTGRLARLDGGPIAQSEIELQAIVGKFGDTRSLATIQTDGDGGFTAAIPARPNLLVRAVHPTRPAAVSDLIELGPI